MAQIRQTREEGMGEEVTVVGVDCATDASNVGVALAFWRPGVVHVREVAICDRKNPPRAKIFNWLNS